jgi:glucosamine--fructose-6-phosphate aminotransferase (isomerizing)
MENIQSGKSTISEILSQPQTWKESLLELSKISETNLPDPDLYDQVIFTGCGSTYFLAIWASRLLKELGHKNCISLPASELWISGDTWINSGQKSLLIAISRSGETTETLRAVEYMSANKTGDILAISCYPKSQLVKMASYSLTTQAGQETSIAQTRSFTNMMLSVLKFSIGEIPVQLPELMRKSSEKAIATYATTSKDIGCDARIERFFFLGNGRFYGLANEIMLKMKEMSLSYSEAFHFLEFRHGPMSMVNPTSLIVGLHTPKSFQLENAVLSEMKNLGALTLSVGSAFHSEYTADYQFDLGTEIQEYWLDPLYLPLLQLIAFERAISNHQDPDRPNNLSAVVEL